MYFALAQVEEAAEFAKGVHELYPHQMLAYNLSPSFNWEKAGMTDTVRTYKMHHNTHTASGRLWFIQPSITYVQPYIA